MQVAAQYQATIELLQQVNETRYPADRVMAQYFKQRRYIGAKDKRAISEQFYSVLRSRLSLSYLLEQASLNTHERLLVALSAKLQGAVLEEIFDGEQYHPKPLHDVDLDGLGTIELDSIEEASLNVQLNVPEWLEPLLQEALGDAYQDEMTAMNLRAATDIRINSLKSDHEVVHAEFEKAGLLFSNTDISPIGIRFNQRVSLFNLDGFKKGNYEVQDEGSQLLAFCCGAKAGSRVVDFCAGAGGKTLALSAMMENKGSLYACDVHSKRLEELQKRAKRAGAHNIRTHLLSSEHDKWVKQHKQTADIVLIDAPCTGTGTWRRNPDSRWNLDAQALENLVALQQSILRSAARLVKPGGKLFYATCSLLREENENQIASFLEQATEFSACELELPESISAHTDKMELNQGSLRMYPGKTATDGFFLGVMQRALAEDEKTSEGPFFEVG